MQPADGVHVRACPLCEAMCGLRVSVEAGRATRIRPNDDDVWSRGFICPKGTALGELHHDPDRVRTPLMRMGDGSFREASWEEALDATARGIHGVIARHGIGAVTAYIGNPTAHNWSLSRYVPAFVALSGLGQTYSAGTVDQWPKNLSSLLMFGGMWAFPIPDLDRTDYLLMLGANPHASQGSLLAAPDVRRGDAHSGGHDAPHRARAGER
jgi:anaerobic selenocysteine-containing dehydrogenase